MTAPAPTSFELALLDEVVALLDPLRAAAESEDARRELLAELGWDGDALGLPATALDAVAEAVDTIEALVDAGGEPTLQTLVQALTATADGFQAVHALAGAVPSAPPDWAGIGAALAELLTCRWLVRRHPLAFRAAVLMTLIRPAHEASPATAVESGGQLVRFPARTPQLRLDQVGKLLSDPVGTLKADYLPTSGSGQARADALADRLLPRLGALIQVLGADALFGTDTVETGDLGTDGAAIAAHALTVRLPLGTDAVGATIALRAPAGGAVGTDVAIAPFGTMALSERAGGWQLELAATAGIDAVIVGPGNVSIASAAGAPVASLDGLATVSKLSAGDEPAILMGSDKATRLEIGAFAIDLAAALATSGMRDFGFEARAQHAAVVVSGGDGDGFLGKLLPASPGLTIPFGLALGWSRSRGLYLGGGTTLAVRLPLHVTLFDVITVEDVDLAISPQAAGVRIDASASAQLTLGPFSAVVQDVGLRADVTFPAGGGNLGPAQLALGFKPPTGAGLALDAGAIAGGGFLAFTDDSYDGVLQLEVAGSLSLKAIGLISTRLPSGQRGFSLLLIITAEFPPIQLGFGFTLNGVGGLVGANRTMAPEVLRTQLHTGGLESLLFPADPVAHAVEVIANLREAFPVAEGRFVFGPMVKLGWGTPTILSLALGVLFELPPPLQIALLGRLRMALPTDEEAVVVLQLDVIGLWDQATGDVSVDATLHDSRMVDFPITGDFALRANIGAHPTFALSAGGFHPAFSPPPGFPHLERVAISLGDSENPRLRLDAYLALTTNTVQVGAGVDLYAYADADLIGRFSVAALLAFDAILHLDPLELQADLSASVDFRLNGASIGSVFLELHLAGPTPWHAWGKARIHFLGTHDFDVLLTVGSEPPPPPIPPVRAIDRLLDDLRAPASWAAAFPSDRHLLASFRKLEPVAGRVVAHPLGSLAVHERSVPLEVTIQRFGTAPVAGPARLSITRATVGGLEVGRTALRDRFAPGQFFALSDDEALRRPAFEEMDAGKAMQLVASTQAAAREGDLHYGTTVVDKEELPATPLYVPSATTQRLLSRTGPAARTAMRVPGAAAVAGPGAPMTAPRWTIADTATLTRAPVGSPLVGLSGHTEAVERLTAHVRSHPEAAGAWQVVEAYEAA
jgi:hypothetical protein